MAVVTVSTDEFTRTRLLRNFHAFVKHFWPLISPYPLDDAWYVKVLCYHLQCLVLDCDDRVDWAENGVNLLVNIPPRTGKSKLLSVLFVAWAWAVNPKLRFVTASYSKEFASRDSKETRMLMNTHEYMRLFPGSRLQSGQNLALRYYTTAGGYRVTMSVESGTTGEGGDIQIFDDPHDVSDSVSKRSRDYAIYYYDKVFFNRSEVPNKAKRVVCGQRVHVDDLSGKLCKSERPKYVHLVIPEEYDPKIAKSTALYTDPRIKTGDLLRPKRMGIKEVEELKSATGLGVRAYAAIYQQCPVGDEGNMFKKRWFDDRFLPIRPHDINNWMRVYDLACTEESTKSQDPDWTASVLGGSNRQYPFVIGDVTRDRMEQPDIDRMVLANAMLDYSRFNRYVPTYFEAVAGFKAVVQHMIHDERVMRGKPAFPLYIPKNFDKMARLRVMQACAEGGGVYLVQGSWNAEFLEELCTVGAVNEKGTEYSEFATHHDDMADAAGSCYNLIYGGSAGQFIASSDPNRASLGQGSLRAPTSPRQAAFRRQIHG